MATNMETEPTARADGAPREPSGSRMALTFARPAPPKPKKLDVRVQMKEETEERKVEITSLNAATLSKLTAPEKKPVAIIPLIRKNVWKPTDDEDARDDMDTEGTDAAGAAANGQSDAPKSRIGRFDL